MKALKLRSLFAFLIILSSNNLFSQVDYEDVVYLKNDSIIHGIIFEQIPCISLTIRTHDGNFHLYKTEEIIKITKEPNSYKSGRPGTFDTYKKGYECVIEMGRAIDMWVLDKDHRPQLTNKEPLNLLKLDVINGYRFNPYCFLGIGTGISYDWGECGYIIYSELDHILIPLFLDFRINFLNHSVSPYLSMAMGGAYSYNFSDDLGMISGMVNPSAGCNFKVSNNLTVNCGVSFETYNMRTRGFHYVTYTQDLNSYNLCINVGISF